MVADVENTLKDNDFFADTVDTRRKGVKQHRKREFFKGTISKKKVLSNKKQWTHERVDKASDKSINKTYAKYEQRELTEKGKKTGRVLGKHMISLYSTAIFQEGKLREVKELQQDIKNGQIIRDQMANLGCLSDGTFGNAFYPSFICCTYSQQIRYWS